MIEPDKNNPPAVPDAAHKGAILKRIREEKGISLEAVHDATKIPLDSLRAIEEGYTVRTLTEFYYRSFVKIYAQFLEIDVNIILEVKKEQLPRYIKKSPELEAGLMERTRKFFTKQRKRQILYTLGAFLGMFLCFKLITTLMTRKPGPAKAKPVAKPITKPLKEESVPEEIVERKPPAQVIPARPARPPEVPVAATVVDAAVEKPQLPLKRVMLTVRAKKTSWLRVKADGDVVFQSNLNAGDAETWSADKQIEITGRNISDLEFEHNGKLIGSLGRSSRDAKGLVVTSEGLSVTK